MTSYSQLKNLLTPNKPVLIVTHQFPDVDAIGSCLALYLQLKKQGIPAKVWSADFTPKDFKFLPDFKDIVTEFPKSFSFSTLCVLDCSSLQRVKNHSIIPIKDDTTIVNIDHHIDNSKFGHINFVQDISSVGELLTCIFKEFNWNVTADIATCLYAAISFDTGRFLYSNSTSQTFSLVSSLLNSGARSFQTNIAMYEDVCGDTFNYIKIGLDNLIINEKLGYCYTFLSKESPKVNYKMIDFIRQLGNIDVFLVFSELDTNLTKISLRSKQFFDVSTFSHQFGGGGHARASGISMNGSASKIIEKICTALESALTAQLNSNV